MDLANMGLAQKSMGAPQVLSMSEQLHTRKQRLQRELDLVGDAIEILEKNPEFKKFFDIISQVGLYS